MRAPAPSTLGHLPAWAGITISRGQTASLKLLATSKGLVKGHAGSLALCHGREQIGVLTQFAHNETHPLGHQPADEGYVAGEPTCPALRPASLPMPSEFDPSSRRYEGANSSKRDRWHVGREFPG